MQSEGVGMEDGALMLGIDGSSDAMKRQHDRVAVDGGKWQPSVGSAELCKGTDADNGQGIQSQVNTTDVRRGRRDGGESTMVVVGG